MKLIAQVKLQASEEQAAALTQTLLAANAAAQYVSDYAWRATVFKQYDLHHTCYYEIREKFDLSAQMAVRVIAKVADAYKLGRQRKRTFQPLGSIAYDDRILSWQLAKRTVNIWTVGGRRRMSFVTGERQMEMLGQLQGEADLLYRDGQYYLHQLCEVDAPDPDDPDGWLSVDLGIVNLASDSDGKCFSIVPVETEQQRQDPRRTVLQWVGAHNARRSRRKLSARRRRLQWNAKHMLGKRTFGPAISGGSLTGGSIAAEDVSGIQEQAGQRRQQGAHHGSSVLAQLCSLLAGKAPLLAVVLDLVAPANTSQLCSCCGHWEQIKRPPRDGCGCVSCGYTVPAHDDAAMHVALRAVLNRPVVPDMRAMSA